MKLPPLNALPIFEAAARLQSFSKAAEENCVSATSVTRFIKILEAYLGFKLFERQANRVVLTELGQKYYLAIQSSMNDISQITEEICRNEADTLRLIAIPAIAETWLVSSLWQFQQQNNQVEIILAFDNSKAPNPYEMLQSNDVWLGRMAPENDDDYAHYLLARDELVLVGNANLIHALDDGQPLDSFNFLEDEDWHLDWQLWLDQNQIASQPKHKVSFERYSMVVNAAIAGEGLMIGHSILIKQYLDMGVLKQPSSFEQKAVPLEESFYAIVKKEQHKASSRFIQWIAKEHL